MFFSSICKYIEKDSDQEPHKKWELDFQGPPTPPPRNAYKSTELRNENPENVPF